MLRTLVFLCWFLLLSSVRDIDAAEEADAAVPLDSTSVAAIVAGLKKVESQLSSFSVSCHAVCEFNHYQPGIDPVAAKRFADNVVASKSISDSVWSLGSDGNKRCETITSSTKIRIDQSTSEERLLHISVYSGKLAQAMYLRARLDPNDTWRGEQHASSSFFCLHEEPTAFITTFLRSKMLSEAIVENHCEIIGTETWHGQRLVVLQSQIPADDAPNYQLYFQLWVDVSKNCVIRRRIYVRQGIDLPWVLANQSDWLDSEYVKNVNLWLPSIVHQWNWIVTNDGQSWRQAENHYSFKDWAINCTLADELFSLNDPLQRLPLSLNH